MRTSHSTADSGDQVPFYLMETVGGGTTLRGYDDFRFRDTRNLVVNVEYRWEVWTYTDLALFYDAGKVFSNENDLNFRDMHSGYGVRVPHPYAGARFRQLRRGSQPGRVQVPHRQRSDVLLLNAEEAWR